MSRGLRNSKILLYSWIKTRTVLNVCRISATLSSSGSKNFSVSPTTRIRKTETVESCSKNDGGFDFREFDIPTLITAVLVVISFLMIFILFAKAFYEYLQENGETLKLHGPDSGSPKVSFWRKIWDEEESGNKKKDIRGVQSEGTDKGINGTKKENSENGKKDVDEKPKKDEADEKWSFWKKKGLRQEDEKNSKDNDEIKIKQEDEKNGKDNEESSWQWWKRKEEKVEKEEKLDKEKTEEKESPEGESKEWFWKTKKDEKQDKDLVQISKIDEKNDKATKKDENPDEKEKKDEVSKKAADKKDPKKQEKTKKVENFYKYEDGYVDGYNTTKTSKVSAFVNQVIQLTIVVLTLIF